MTIEVIGAGFGRTGTMSLKVALEDLGFGPCYHMTEVFDQPKHAELWEAAVRGEPADWEEIFRGYRAIVDWPGAAFYEELMERYPHAKVILTVRDPQRWYESTLNTIYHTRKIASSPLFTVIGLFVPGVRHMKRATGIVNDLAWEETFGGRFEDREHAIQVFDQLNEEVVEHVPAERLLVYEVKEGWETLCEFLGVEAPKDEPFPHLNDTDAFRRRVRRYQAYAYAAPTITAVLVGLALLGYRSHLRRRPYLRTLETVPRLRSTRDSHSVVYSKRTSRAAVKQRTEPQGKISKLSMV